MTRPTPIPAPGGESEAHRGRSPRSKLAGRVPYSPADFSKIDGEDYDGKVDGARSYDAAMAYFREVHLRDPNAPELGKGRW